MAITDVKSFSSSNIISMKQLQLCTGPIWTARELKFLRDNYNKLTYNELANRLKRSKGAIKRRVDILKLRRLTQKKKRDIKNAKNEINTPTGTLTRRYFCYNVRDTAHLCRKKVSSILL